MTWRVVALPASIVIIVTVVRLPEMSEEVIARARLPVTGCGAGHDHGPGVKSADGEADGDGEAEGVGDGEAEGVGDSEGDAAFVELGVGDETTATRLEPQAEPMTTVIRSAASLTLILPADLMPSNGGRAGRFRPSRTRSR